MKRLVSVFLVLCMMLSCVAFGETLDGAQGEIMNEVSDVASDEVQTPDEPTQAPVNEDDIVLPDMDDDISILPSDDVNGPDPYRELVLLQPTDLIGTTLSETSVRIGWGSVAFATQYDVYRKLGGETSYTLLGSVPNNRLYYEDTNVTPGQAVYYRVRAVNVSYDGEQAKYVYSPDSQTLSYMTLAKPKLQDPRGLGADTIRLNWSSVSGAQTYEVQMSTNATSGFTTVRTDLTGTLCNATGLKKATGYYFRVRAVRVFSSGEKFYSEYSNVGCGTPMDRPELTVVQSGNNAQLSWPASSGATGYIIYRKTGASGSYTLLAKTGAVTSFVDASINLGEVYYYFIYSMRPVGSYNCFSLSSERVYFTALGSVNLCAVRNTGKQEQTIDWDTTVLGANKYYVYSSTTMDGLYTKIGETEGTTYVAKNLVAGTTYYYKVRPVRVFSNGTICYGPWSNVMSQPESGSLTLEGLSAVNLSAGQDISGGYVGDVFSWSATVSGGSGVQIQPLELLRAGLAGGGQLAAPGQDLIIGGGGHVHAIPQDGAVLQRDVQGDDGHAQLLGFGGQDVGRRIGENTDHKYNTSEGRGRKTTNSSEKSWELYQMQREKVNCLSKNFFAFSQNSSAACANGGGCGTMSADGRAVRERKTGTGRVLENVRSGGAALGCTGSGV